MLSKRLTISDAKFTRLIAALESRRERKGEPDEETDGQLYMRWLKSLHTDPVFKHECKTAMDTVAPDPDIVDIT